MIRPVLIALFSIIYLFSSCEKAEQPVRLPARGTTTHSEPVNMGERYLDQYFYDLSSNKVVYTSLIDEWDLAFETSPTGFHVLVNTTKLVVYNTKETDIYKVNEVPNIADNEWKIDVQAGGMDSTAIGDWTKPGGNSKGEVYILKYDTSVLSPSYKKLVINSFSPTEYAISFGDLESNNITTVKVPKEAIYNFSYYAFGEGVLYPEPPKDSWDIVFTRYKFPFYAEGLNYPVVGVLINPYKARAALVDSFADYTKVDVHTLDTLKLTNRRDVIGFDWKIVHVDVNSGKATYTIDKNKVYVINDRFNFYWKLHFLDFYDQNGIKGSPSFEFERLQ